VGSWRVFAQSLNHSQSIDCSLGIGCNRVLSDRNRRYEEAMQGQQARLQAQEQLASVREDFASTLTHDLKTPLLGAGGVIELWMC
jgi:signal transduction histidine kinase